jgi:3-oxoacyl-[acyl-carrier protein] reductase
MNFNISGKSVLVVGASKGIGRAIAKAYAEEGAIVTAIARSESQLKSLIEEIGGPNSVHRYFVFDMMETGMPTKASQLLLEDYKYFDIVIQCIGGIYKSRDPFSSIEFWINEWIFNVGIAIEMNNILIPPMVKRGWGRIIHISSISSKMLRGNVLYTCAKSYLNAYVINMGRLLANKGIIVSALMPGAVEFKDSYWEKIRNNNPDKYFGFLKEHQAIGRMGKPEEIAAFAVFLGSEQASFAAASLITVDGGNM